MTGRKGSIQKFKSDVQAQRKTGRDKLRNDIMKREQRLRRDGSYERLNPARRGPMGVRDEEISH